MQESYALPVLAHLPLVAEIREACDRGEPSLVEKKSIVVQEAFEHLAQQVAAQLAKLPLYKRSRIPKVVVE